LPNIDHLQVDWIQEDSKLATRGIGKNHHDVENQVLATHNSRERGKRKRNRDRESNSAPDPKKKNDFSYI
jgi:hypothetical protein